MAKVKFSALISEMRNKLNGSVFARNRGGAYLRTKVTPSNPQSLAQVQARARLTQFAQGWRGLTEDQRNAWTGAVSNWTSTDIFGDLTTPTGNTLYTRLNVNILNAGGVAITSPPSPQGAAPLLLLETSANVFDTTMEVVTDPETIPAGHALVVRATPMLSPGVNNANSQFRIIEVIPAAAEGPHDVWASYVAKFGTPIVGQKYFIKAELVRLATGEKSQAQTASAIVAA